MNSPPREYLDLVLTSAFGDFFFAMKHHLDLDMIDIQRPVND